MSGRRSFQLPPGFRVALDPSASLWSGGQVITGGSPWKVVRLGEAALPHVAALRRAGPEGVAVSSPVERALARQLLDHGMLHPVPVPHPGPHEVTVVVPAFGRPDELERTLGALKDVPVIVVDDASPDPGPLRDAATAYGARLVRHSHNRGPAAARNTGARLAETPFVAFVDSDCCPPDGWLDVLMPHFDDPRVAAVAPRVVPRSGDQGLLARYEAARSALDMGRRPALVKPGGKLGFVPTATLVVRVSALKEAAFDEELRLGEDVDFVWRLGDIGWNVRYEPAAQVGHTPRLRPLDWARRRHEYGTSAAELARRHPGRLAPARPSAWNLAVLGLLVRGNPGGAAVCQGVTSALLARRLSKLPADWSLATAIVAKGVVADSAAIGHALRREWWPLGLLSLGTCGRSRFARAAVMAMIAPIALEWVRERPAVDPVRYTLLRLAEDVAYGSGVTAAAARGRTAAPLRPEIRLPEGWARWISGSVRRGRRASASR